MAAPGARVGRCTAWPTLTPPHHGPKAEEEPSPLHTAKSLKKQPLKLQLNERRTCGKDTQKKSAAGASQMCKRPRPTPRCRRRSCPARPSTAWSAGSRLDGGKENVTFMKTDHRASHNATPTPDRRRRPEQDHHSLGHLTKVGCVALGSRDMVMRRCEPWIN